MTVTSFCLAFETFSFQISSSLIDHCGKFKAHKMKKGKIWQQFKFQSELETLTFQTSSVRHNFCEEGRSTAADPRNLHLLFHQQCVIWQHAVSPNVNQLEEEQTFVFLSSFGTERTSIEDHCCFLRTASAPKHTHAHKVSNTK